ncbi:hypothetical protein [Tsukamurella pulmonis]|uniref:hypothetical protein n=1 Tax=Tsukamurella pulmonis TaxID=47312 RepID=UPI001EE09E4F|nr:hypothetical protein [Tsukamurella pulmonis]
MTGAPMTNPDQHPGSPHTQRSPLESGPYAPPPYYAPGQPPRAYPTPIQYGFTPHQIVVTQVAAPTNSAGVAGLVIGFTALLFSFIPVIGLIAWLLAPIGLLLSGIGMTRPPKGAAIAGMILSGFALLICFAWLLLIAV